MCSWLVYGGGVLTIVIISILIDQVQLLTYSIVSPRLLAETERILGKLTNLFKEKL